MAQYFASTGTEPLNGSINPGEVAFWFDPTTKTLYSKDENDIVTIYTSSGGVSPMWTTYTFTHTQLQSGGLINNIELVSLPVKTVVHAVSAKHSIAFGSGGSITEYFVSVGVAGALQKYMLEFDVWQTVADTSVAKKYSDSSDRENDLSVTSLRIAARSVGADLDQSITGSVAVSVLTSVIP